MGIASEYDSDRGTMSFFFTDEAPEPRPLPTMEELIELVWRDAMRLPFCEETWTTKFLRKENLHLSSRNKHDHVEVTFYDTVYFVKGTVGHVQFRFSYAPECSLAHTGSWPTVYENGRSTEFARIWLYVYEDDASIDLSRNPQLMSAFRDKIFRETRAHIAKWREGQQTVNC